MLEERILNIIHWSEQAAGQNLESLLFQKTEGPWKFTYDFSISVNKSLSTIIANGTDQ